MTAPSPSSRAGALLGAMRAASAKAEKIGRLSQALAACDAETFVAGRRDGVLFAQARTHAAHLCAEYEAGGGLGLWGRMVVMGGYVHALEIALKTEAAEAEKAREAERQGALDFKSRAAGEN